MAMQEKDLLFDFDDLAIDESILPASTATATANQSIARSKNVAGGLQESRNDESGEAKKKSFVVSHGLYRDYLRGQINRCQRYDSRLLA